MLSPIERARIFAMYLGCMSIATENGQYHPPVRLTHHNFTSALKYPDLKLLLRNLSELTDAEAIEVAKMYFKDQDVEVNDGKHIISKYILKKYYDGLPFSEAYSIYQYLISIGIAVPLFIAPGHEDNGKTSIEMGLAVNYLKGEGKV